MMLSLFAPYSIFAQERSELIEAQVSCSYDSCEGHDALVFVHGIYGGKDTFKNSTTGFDWPREVRTRFEDIDGVLNEVDVYQLLYNTEFFDWSATSADNFREAAKSILETLKPLRQKRYRSIGFITHSLGGNIVATYIHMIKSRYGHANRSQHAFSINIATPWAGSQTADIATLLRSLLGMRADGFLASLSEDNQYLQMLQTFVLGSSEKQEDFGCRPVTFHAAYEMKHVGPLMIVQGDSVLDTVSELVDSQIKGFNSDHIEIVKPENAESPIYKWVDGLLDREYDRLDDWQKLGERFDTEAGLCVAVPLLEEEQ